MLPELDKITQDLDADWRTLTDTLDQLSEDELSRSPGDGQYSGREMLAHLAGAERGLTRLLELMAAGEFPRLRPDYNNDFYNARQQEKRAKLSTNDLRAELQDLRAKLLAFMETLRAEDLPKHGEHPTQGILTVRGVLESLQQHEHNHIAEFGAWADTMIRTRK